MKELLIFGSGDGGIELLEIIKQINNTNEEWSVIGFVDSHKSGDIDGIKIGRLSDFNINNETYGICGVMDPKLRKSITEKEIVSNNIRLATIIHPLSNLASDFKATEGCIIFPGVRISHGVKIEKGTFLNYNVIIGHEAQIDEYNYCAPGVIINAECQIGKSCIFGSGAILIPRINIGSGCVIGIGTTILNDIPEKKRVMDLPRKLTNNIE